MKPNQKQMPNQKDSDNTDQERVLYEEKKRHGDALLPFAVYGTMMPTLFSSFPLHCHAEIEVVLADCGSCHYNLAGNEETLHMGDILAIMPWVLHSFRLDREDKYFLGSTYLISTDMLGGHAVDICTSRYLNPLLHRACNDYCVIRVGDPHYEACRRIIIELFDTYADRDDFFELKLKSLLHGLFYRLLEGGYIRILEETPDGDDVRLVRQVVDYISDHYAENITLGGLAQLVSLSETGLSRLFRSVTGLSCIDYVIEYRLTKAMGFLRTTDKSVSEIACETGFNNISYFNRMFKRYFELTPSQARKKIRSSE